MLVPNLRPKVVPHDGSRLLPRFIVRARGRLVASRSPSESAACSRPSDPALRLRGIDARHPRPVAPLPQRARLLALRSLPPLRPYFPTLSAPGASSTGAFVLWSPNRVSCSRTLPGGYASLLPSTT